jgi:hypothetical protein
MSIMRFSLTAQARESQACFRIHTSADAAEVLVTSEPRVIQFGDKYYLPYLVASNRWRLYRSRSR